LVVGEYLAVDGEGEKAGPPAIVGALPAQQRPRAHRLSTRIWHGFEWASTCSGTRAGAASRGAERRGRALSLAGASELARALLATALAGPIEP